MSPARQNLSATTETLKQDLLPTILTMILNAAAQFTKQIDNYFRTVSMM